MFKLYNKTTNELEREDENRFNYDETTYYLVEEDTIKYRKKMRKLIKEAVTIEDLKNILLKLI